MAHAETRRSGTWKRKVLLALVTTVLMLGVCEIGLRLVWHNSYASDSTDHMLRLGIQLANRDYLVDRRIIDPESPVVRLRTDARSYIVPSFQYDDPDVTIAFLGGSTTECSAVKEELRFPALVSELFAEKGLHVNTLNAGAAGNTMHDSINVLFNHVALDKPDIAIVMHATNDFGILVQHQGYQTRSGGPLELKHLLRWAKQKLSRYSYVFAVVRKFLSKYNVRPIEAVELKQRNSVAWADQVPGEQFEQRARIFVAMCRELGIQPVLMTQPLSTQTNSLTPKWADLGGQDRFNSMIRNVGMVENVPVIDLARHVMTLPRWDEDGELFYDGMHVTDKGSQAYAEYIAQRLERVVLDVAARRNRYPRK